MKSSYMKSDTDILLFVSRAVVPGIDERWETPVEGAPRTPVQQLEPNMLTSDPDERTVLAVERGRSPG